MAELELSPLQNHRENVPADFADIWIILMDIRCSLEGKVNHEALSLMKLGFIFILIEKY